MSVDPEVSAILKSWVLNARTRPREVAFGTLTKSSRTARWLQGAPPMTWQPNGQTKTGWVIFSGSDAYSSSPYSSHHATPDLFLDQSGTAWDLVRSGQANCYQNAKPATFQKAHLGTYVTGDRNFLRDVVDQRRPVEWHYMTIETDSSLDRAPRFVPLSSLAQP